METLAINDDITSLLNNLIMNLPKTLLAEILRDANNSGNILKEIPSEKHDNRMNSKKINSKDLRKDSQSNDTNVNWSKLYPEMSFHSFMRKIANGNITVPKSSTKSNEQKHRHQSQSSGNKIKIIENQVINSKVENINQNHDDPGEEGIAVESALDLSTHKSDEEEKEVDEIEAEGSANEQHMQLRNKKKISKSSTKRAHSKNRRLNPCKEDNCGEN